MNTYENIVIQIREGIDINMAMHLVNSVVANGRDQRGKFEFKTAFNTLQGEAFVYTRPYTKQDCFVVCRDGNIKRDDL